MSVSEFKLVLDSLHFELFDLCAVISEVDLLVVLLDLRLNKHLENAVWVWQSGQLFH